jgi:hypothetical protein
MHSPLPLSIFPLRTFPLLLPLCTSLLDSIGPSLQAPSVSDAQVADREAGMSLVGDGSVGDWIGVDLKSPTHGAPPAKQEQQQQ